MKGGSAHLWRRMAWNWNGIANIPMVTSARARFAMYMLVTVRRRRKMTYIIIIIISIIIINIIIIIIIIIII